MGDLISLIVPVYNVEKYVAHCLKSLIMQTYTNIEIIVVDDGATDKSGRICDEVATKDKRVTVYHTENGGLSAARNFGLLKATGTWVAFIDSDDWVDREYVEKLYHLAISEKVNMVCCGKCIATDEKNIILKCKANNTTIYSREKFIKDVIHDREIGVAAWGKLYKKFLFEKVRYPEREIHEDVAVLYTLLEGCAQIAVLSEALYYYRENMNGISKQNYSHKYDVVLKHDLENESKVAEQYPNLKNYMSVAVAKSCVEMLIKILKTPNGNTDFATQKKEYLFNLRKRLIVYLANDKVEKKSKIWAILFATGLIDIIYPILKK